MLFYDYFVIMLIESSQLLELLREFSALSPAHREILLYCLEQQPTIIYYSGDVQAIADTLQLNPRTVQRALQSFRRQPVINQCVSVRRINHAEQVRADYRAYCARQTAQDDALS